MIRIAEDKGQKTGKHENKRTWFQQNGIKVYDLPLPVGDYILMNEKVEDVIKRKAARVMINKDKETGDYITKIGTDLKKIDFLGTYNVAVDTKKDLDEVIKNIQNKTHGRFRDELILAQNNGIKLFILIEHGGGIETLEDVQYWQNPRLLVMKRFTDWDGIRKTIQAYPKATTGATLYKSMKTMEEKYGVKFLFCNRRDTGKKIVEILGGVLSV